MSSPRRRARWGWFALVLLEGCAMRYRDLSNNLGLQSALEHKLVEDGETLNFAVRNDETNSAIPGMRFVIGTGAKQISFVSDSNGQIAIPVSRRLFAENPKVDIQKPPGVNRWSFSFTFSGACDDRARSPRKVSVQDATVWTARDVGPDRVYSESGIGEEKPTAVADLLSKARSILAELTDLPPPPIAIALIQGPLGSLQAANDMDGRPIWPLEANTTNDNDIGLIVHEWTHSILRKNFKFEGDQRSRYIEDGLCELMSHLVLSRVRNSSGSEIAKNRLVTLEMVRSKYPPVVNLTELSQSFHGSRYKGMLDILLAQCNVGGTFGYSLGLAYWLDHLDSRPDLVRMFFSKLRTGVGTSTQALIKTVDEISPVGLTATAIDVAGAAAVLQRHISVRQAAP